MAGTAEALTFLGLFSIVPGIATIFIQGREVRACFLVNRLPFRLKDIVELLVFRSCPLVVLF